MERRVVGDAGWQRLEQVLGLHRAPWVEVDVAVENKAGLAWYSDRAAVDLAVLHIALVQVLVVV